MVMAGWSWESFCQFLRTSVHVRGKDEMGQNQAHDDDDVSKANWSELPEDGDDVMTSIEKSKVHWSELPADGSSDTEVLAELEIQANNETSWKALQDLNPFFFQDWSEKVQVGRQIAEGGQAQVFAAKWKKDEYRNWPLEELTLPEEMVVKVFKLDGCTLEHFISQWPRISTTSQTELECERDSDFASFYMSIFVCPIVGAYFLNNKRFAFLMERYDCDLRSLIDNKMRDKRGHGPPLSNKDAQYVLLCIARGMQWLHDHGVLHRDLKASNVLVRVLRSRYDMKVYVVSDYECSMSTVGTGFWRAPEVLQEMQHGRGRNQDTWTTKSDVYSFGMICFEVLTGCIPFSEYAGKKDWVEIIDHHKRPQLPDYVDSKLQELVKRCWDKDPSKRPSFHDIVYKYFEFEDDTGRFSTGCYLPQKL